MQMRYRTIDRLLGFLAVALMAVSAAGRADPPHVEWAEPVEVASGDAFHGPWRMNRSRFLFVDDPTVAINDAGVVAVAWADQSEKDIYLQIYAGDGSRRLGAPVNVSRTPEVFSWLPRMVISQGEPLSVYILWQEIIFSGGSHGGEILFARSRDGGRTFNGPLNLSNSLAGDGKGRLTRRYWDNGSLDLIMGTDGILYAAWTEYDGALWFSRSTDRGESFSPAQAIAGGNVAGPARGPALAVDSDNVVFLAWTVGEDRRADIRIARSDDGGRSFGEAAVVLESDGHSDAPKIVVDNHGVVHLVHAEGPDGPFQRYHIRYSRSDDRGRTFAEPREISGALAGEFESSHYPTLAHDGMGNLYVVWELFSDRQRRSRGLGFASASIDDGAFARASVVPGTFDGALGDNGSRQGLLMRKLSVNGVGAIAVVNSTFKRDEVSSVWLYRGRRDGN